MSTLSDAAAPLSIDPHADSGSQRLRWLVGLIAALLLASALPAVLQIHQLSQYQQLVQQSSGIRERAEHLRAVVGGAWVTVQKSVSQGQAPAEAVMAVRRVSQRLLSELMNAESAQPTQVARVQALGPLIERRFDVLQASLQAGVPGVAAGPNALSTARELVESVNAVDRVIDALLKGEEELLAERERGFDRAMRLHLAVELVGVALSLVLLVVAFRLLQNDVRRRRAWTAEAQRSRDALAAANRSLRDEVEKRTQTLALRNDALSRAHERLSLMSRQLLAVAEQERRALARELHDDFGQLLTTLKMKLLLLQESNRVEELEECVHLAEDGVSRVRERAFTLRPAELDEIGLGSALRSQAQKEMRSSQVEISVQVHPELEAERGEWATAVYRIVQEAVRNAVHHGQPRHVDVQVELHRDGISALRVVVVRDDGAGLAQGGSEKPRLGGLGLVTMRERAELLGGHFEIGNVEPHGTIVRCSWPVNVQHETLAS